MSKSQAQRVEELSQKMGGRYKLTTLALKRMRDYHLGGRTFMPNVDNLDELFEYVLDEIEKGEITLRLPGEQPKTLLQATKQISETEETTEETETEAGEEQDEEQEAEEPSEEDDEDEEEEE